MAVYGMLSWSIFGELNIVTVAVTLIGATVLILLIDGVLRRQVRNRVRSRFRDHYEQRRSQMTRGHRRHRSSHGSDQQHGHHEERRAA